MKKILVSWLLIASVMSSNAGSYDKYMPDNDFDKVVNYFSNLSLSVRKADNPSLYYEIFKWIGTGYRWGGSSKSGTDCSGFVRTIYEGVYGKLFPGTSRSFFGNCREVPSDAIAEGDLVFFRINSSQITHVGIYLQYGKFAHASTSKGVIISDLSDPYFHKYFYKAARYDLLTVGLGQNDD
jgi:lipoprotein Spr